MVYLSSKEVRVLPSILSKAILSLSLTDDEKRVATRLSEVLKIAKSK